MTDQRDPTPNDPTPDDATSRVPTPSPSATPTPAAPTAPLTPASQATSTPPAFEHEVAYASGPVPASPVLPPKAPRRGGRVRWAVSLAVIAVVVLASAAVAALVTGQSTSTVLGYVPPATTVYAEVRLDLPGDQRAAAGEFLSKFPGFADQAALDSKLDEMLDQLVKDATERRTDLHRRHQAVVRRRARLQRRPVAACRVTWPTAGRRSSGHPGRWPSCRSRTRRWPRHGSTRRSPRAAPRRPAETYNGASLTVFEPSDGATAALAMIDGKVALAGDIASVKAAIDTNGSSGFASEPGPKAAIDSVDGDHVAFGYVALRPLLDWSNELNKATESAVGGMAMEGISDSILKVVPEWTAYWLRFENDALVMEATAPRPETASGPTENRNSTIAEHVPSSAIFAATSHDLGKSLKEMLGLYALGPRLQADPRPAHPGPRSRRRRRRSVRLGSRLSGRRRRRQRHPRRRPDRRADRRRRGQAAVHRAADVPHPRWRPGRRDGPRRGPTTARPSRSSPSATSARSPAWPVARPAPCPCRSTRSRSPTR